MQCFWQICWFWLAVCPKHSFPTPSYFTCSPPFVLKSLLIYVLICFLLLLFLQRYSSHRAAFDFLGVSFQRNLSGAGKRQPQLCFCVFSPLFFTSTCLYLPALSFEMPSFYLAPFFISLHLPYGSVFIPHHSPHPLVCASEVCRECWCSVGFYTVEAPKTPWHRRRVGPGPSDHSPPRHTHTLLQNSPRTALLLYSLFLSSLVLSRLNPRRASFHVFEVEALKWKAVKEARIGLCVCARLEGGGGGGVRCCAPLDLAMMQFL